MLSFISFWRAAAIVLSDLASSAYYAGGIAETRRRQVRPLVHPGDHAVLLRRARHLHRELFDVRARRRLHGGPRGHGRNPGQVLGLRPHLRLRAHRPHQRGQRRPYLGRPHQRNRRASTSLPWHVHPPYFAAGFAAVVTLYFWRNNIMGMHESSEKALRIMQIATGWWWPYRLVHHHYSAKTATSPCRSRTLHTSASPTIPLGWLKGTVAPPSPPSPS